VGKIQPALWGFIFSSKISMSTELEMSLPGLRHSSAKMAELSNPLSPPIAILARMLTVSKEKPGQVKDKDPFGEICFDLPHYKAPLRRLINLFPSGQATKRQLFLCTFLNIFNLLSFGIIGDGETCPSPESY
jgi:hypothetical protein